MATFCDLVVTRWGARYRGRHVACAIGRGGIGAKGGEGDGITPAGTWAITRVFARTDRVATGHATRISPDLHWVDDPAARAYNQPVRALRPGVSAERMFRADPLYDLVAVLSYNADPVVPGKGSAIFLHNWRKPRHPTEGCVAFRRGDLVAILATWTARSRVIIHA